MNIRLITLSSLLALACASPRSTSSENARDDAGALDGGATTCAELRTNVAGLLGSAQTCSTSADCRVTYTNCGLPGVCGTFASKTTEESLKPLLSSWSDQNCAFGQACPDCAGPSAVACVSDRCQAAPLSAGGACTTAEECPTPMDAQYKPSCLAGEAFTGGYCALPCAHGFGCPVPDARCRSVSATGSATFCFHACQADADCRIGEGYRCCPNWNGFGEPGSVCYPGTCPAGP